MDITQRVAEALRVVAADFATMHEHDLERSSYAQPLEANVVYLGADECRELRVGTHSTMFSGAAQYIIGLRIVEVRLSNWLQVTHVDGVK